MSELKNYYQNLVNTSQSFSEILRKQHKAVSGASIKLLKTTLDSLNINYSHIKYRQPVRNRRPLSQILVENSVYSSRDLKTRLIEAGLKVNRCEICGQSPIWNNKKLTLQLDHINGNHFDNRLHNLRIVCPNCHSQLETQGTHRFKVIKRCPDCGKIITSKSTYCRQCAATHRRGKKWRSIVSKQELLQLVLTLPFTEIAKKFNITDNAVRKYCRKLGIPSTKTELFKYRNKMQQIAI